MVPSSTAGRTAGKQIFSGPPGETLQVDGAAGQVGAVDGDLGDLPEVDEDAAPLQCHHQPHAPAHRQVPAGVEHAAAVDIAGVHLVSGNAHLLQRFEQALDEVNVGGDAHGVLKSESSLGIDRTVSGEIRLGGNVVSHRNTGAVHGNEDRPPQVKPDLLAGGRIRLAVNVGPQDEDRLGMLLHERMNPEEAGRGGVGRKHRGSAGECRRTHQQ